MVGFAGKVVHVTFSGQMLGGGEEWTTGFYMGRPEGDADVPTQAFADAVRDAWVTFFTHAEVGISSYYNFQQVKCVKLGLGGQYNGEDPAVSFPATAVVGASGGNPLPPQLALVATLIAGSGKGLAGKGRMFLPGIKEPIDITGHLPLNYTQKVATRLSEFFNTVNAIAGAPGEAIQREQGP
jgi:hypothetical protein